MKANFLVLSLLLLAVTTSYCEDEKVDDPENIERGGVVLTFDDRNFEDWLAAIPLFEKYEASVTFFISGPIDEDALKAALELKRNGHAIGAHSVRHLSAIEYQESHSAAEFVEKEVMPQVRVLRKAGITPTAFAYPMSKDHPETDRELLKLFRHLRTGRNIKSDQEIRDRDDFFVPVEKISESGLLVGKGIDFAPSREDRTFEKIDAALSRAAENREVLVLYAHRITPIGSGNFITPSALEHVLKSAKALDLSFLTVDQLP